MWIVDRISFSVFWLFYYDCKTSKRNPHFSWSRIGMRNAIFWSVVHVSSCLLLYLRKSLQASIVIRLHHSHQSPNLTIKTKSEEFQRNRFFHFWLWPSRVALYEPTPKYAIAAGCEFPFSLSMICAPADWKQTIRIHAVIVNAYNFSGRTLCSYISLLFRHLIKFIYENYGVLSKNKYELCMRISLPLIYLRARKNYDVYEYAVGYRLVGERARCVVSIVFLMRKLGDLYTLRCCLFTRIWEIRIPCTD